MNVLNRGVLVIASAAVAACASSQSNAAVSRDEPAAVIVDNRSVLDMNIYVIRAGQRIRLGTAGGLNKTRLTIPGSLVFGATTLRFLADPIGSSRSPVSEEINVSAGDEIELTIPPSP